MNDHLRHAATGDPAAKRRTPAEMMRGATAAGKASGKREVSPPRTMSDLIRAGAGHAPAEPEPVEPPVPGDLGFDSGAGRGTAPKQSNMNGFIQNRGREE